MGFIKYQAIENNRSPLRGSGYFHWNPGIWKSWGELIFTRPNPQNLEVFKNLQIYRENHQNFSPLRRGHSSSARQIIHHTISTRSAGIFFRIVQKLFCAGDFCLLCISAQSASDFFCFVCIPKHTRTLTTSDMWMKIDMIKHSKRTECTFSVSESVIDPYRWVPLLFQNVA